MLLRGQPWARLILVVCFRSRGKHNRSRRGHVTAYRAVRSALKHSQLWWSRVRRVITSSPKSRLRFSEYRFYPFGSEILLIFTYGILLQINFILLRVTLLLAMTYNKCAKYSFTIHEIDIHDNILKC